MAQTLHSIGRSGTYSILSAFIFIIIAIVLVLGVIYYEVFITNIENNAKDELNKYDVAKDARNTIIYCYGNIIDTSKFNKSCNVPLIKGYSITRLDMNNCTFMQYNSTNISGHYSQVFTYAIPITEEGITCLGRLNIFS